MPENYFDVKLVKDWDKYKAGDTVAVRTTIAKNLVAQGIARSPYLNPIVPEPPKVKAKPKAAKKKVKKHPKTRRL